MFPLTTHGWKIQQSIQEATASERLTLAEEYENQASWRAAHDKLTFILCQPLSISPLSPSHTQQEQEIEESAARAGEVDGPGRMIGDINFFLYPDDEHEDDEQQQQRIGEVDIMIADARHRGQGLGRAAVAAFLYYVMRNADGILGEYHQHQYQYEHSITTSATGESAQRPRLKMLMAKIKKDNGPSIALFRGLGFEQRGGVNYFGEVELVLRDLEGSVVVREPPEGYKELVYNRPEGDDV